MEPQEYAKMHAMETTNWWFQGKRILVNDLLRPLLAGREDPALLDIGCGTGLFLDDLNAQGRATGLDFSPLALEFCHQRGIERLVRADATRLPIADDSADVITLLDITEHVKDDRALVCEVARVLKPDGAALFSVPAHPSLWSEHDEALWHHRRYTKRTFKALFEDSGLVIERCTYAFMFTFPPAALLRLVKRFLPQSGEPKTDNLPLPGFLHRLLAQTLRVEAWLLRMVNLPMGISIVVIARKVR